MTGFLTLLRPVQRLYVSHFNPPIFLPSQTLLEQALSVAFAMDRLHLK